MATQYRNGNSNGNGKVTALQTLRAKLSGGLTQMDVRTNSGEVSKDEAPLWMGYSGVKDVKGASLIASVTVERDWLWLRFSDKPHSEYRKWLFEKGFIWSGKRGGYHHDNTLKNINTLKQLGAVTLDWSGIEALSALMVEEWISTQQAKQAERDNKAMANTIAAKAANAMVVKPGMVELTFDITPPTKVVVPTLPEVVKAVKPRRNRFDRLVDANGNPTENVAPKGDKPRGKNGQWIATKDVAIEPTVTIAQEVTPVTTQVTPDTSIAKILEAMMAQQAMMMELVKSMAK